MAISASNLELHSLNTLPVITLTSPIEVTDETDFYTNPELLTNVISVSTLAGEIFTLRNDGIAKFSNIGDVGFNWYLLGNIDTTDANFTALNGSTMNIETVYGLGGVGSDTLTIGGKVIVTDKIQGNATDNSLPNQTYSSLDSILTPRVNAGLRGYIINRRCNVGGTWSTSHASGGGASARPSHLQCYNNTTLNSKTFTYEEQASICPLGTATTNGYSQFKWDMSEMWFDWVFNLTYAINSTGIRTNQLVKLFAGNVDTEGMIRNYGGLGVYIVSGSSATNYDIRIFHGFGLPYYRAAISAATNASPIVITQNSHGFVTNDQIEIDGCVGNTAANGIWTVTRIDNNTYSLNGSTGNGTWTSGGNSHYISNVLLNTDALNTKLARILIHKTGGVFNVWLNDTILIGSVTYAASGQPSTPNLGFGSIGQMAKTLVASTGSTNMYLYELNYGGKN